MTSTGPHRLRDKVLAPTGCLVGLWQLAATAAPWLSPSGGTAVRCSAETSQPRNLSTFSAQFQAEAPHIEGTQTLNATRSGRFLPAGRPAFWACRTATQPQRRACFVAGGDPAA